MVHSIANVKLAIINHPVDRADVIEGLEHTFSSIKEDVLPALKEFESHKNEKYVKNNQILTTIATICGIRSKKGDEIVAKLYDLFDTFASQETTLMKIANNVLSKVVVDKTMTIRDGAILRLIGDIEAATQFVLDVVYLSLVDDKETFLPKKKLTDIRKNMPAFGEIYKSYSTKFKEIVAGLEKLPTMEVGDTGKESLVEMALSKISSVLLTALPTTQGFIGNPIYHIRMWLVDREMAKFESLKVKRSLINLKLLELRHKANGEDNEDLTKQIQYYEDKVASIDYKLEKIQDKAR